MTILGVPNDKEVHFSFLRIAKIGEVRFVPVYVFRVAHRTHLNMCLQRMRQMLKQGPKCRVWASKIRFQLKDVLVEFRDSRPGSGSGFRFYGVAVLGNGIASARSSSRWFADP